MNHSGASPPGRDREPVWVLPRPLKGTEEATPLLLVPTRVSTGVGHWSLPVARTRWRANLHDHGRTATF